MKINKKNIIILLVLILICIILFAIDYNRVNDNTKPIFCIQTKLYEDGGSTEYIGLGYKVIKYVRLEESKTIYKIGTWFMKFDNPLDKDIPEEYLNNFKDINFNSTNIQTHLYIDNFVNPSVDIIKSTNDLENYKTKYIDDKLHSSLKNYTESYFNNKVLVIVNIQESSGSNTNEVDRISKLEELNRIDIFVKKDVPQIGTTDMAMWHLLVEIDKKDFGNTDSISIIDFTNITL